MQNKRQIATKMAALFSLVKIEQHVLGLDSPLIKLVSKKGKQTAFIVHRHYVLGY